MTSLRFLRVVILCLLGFGFHTKVVNADKKWTFTEPSNLKDILDLLGKFKSNDKVAETIDRNVQEYLIGRGTRGSSLKRNLKDIITRVAELRKVLLKDPKHYGKYSDFENFDGSIGFCATTLVHWLPILHSEMWSLHFQTAEESVRIGGGAWREQKFGKTNHTAQLHHWLTSKGFKGDDLHENNLGKHVAGKTGIKLYKGGPLNHAQYGLMFLSPTWHDSNLASTVLFLQEFCKDIKEQKFYRYKSSPIHGNINSTCNSLSTDLTLLSGILLPLYNGSTTLYGDKLRHKYFPSYAEWLGRNLGSMKKSLGQMLSESSKWTASTLQSAISAGPFKYGFVFKDSKWEEPIKSKLPSALESLTQSKSETLSILGQDPTSTLVSETEVNDEEEEYDEEKVDTDTLDEASAGESEGEPDVADTEEEESDEENTDAETLDNTAEESDAEEELGTVQSQNSSDYPTNEYSGIALSSPLKDILDLLGTLYQSGVEFQVLDTVRQKIEAYLQPTGIPGESVKKNLDGAFQRIAKLRKMLLKNPDDYGEYSNYKPSEGSLFKYADFLAQWLPILHSELYDFYLQSGLQCVPMEDGSLKTHPHGRSRFHSLVHRWFTDMLDTTTVPCINGQSRDVDPHKDTHGPHIVARTGTSLSGGRLSYAQYGLFFLSPTWHDSNLGSVVLFLQEFCRDVQAKKFDNYLSGNKYGGLKSVCSQLSDRLTSLTDALHPLYHGSTTLYEGKLKTEAFPSYAEWLGRNLDGVVKSLNAMSTDSKHWKATPLEETLSVGPFWFGFVFKDKTWTDSTRAKLVEYIQVLTNSGTGALTKLSAALTKSMSEISGEL